MNNTDGARVVEKMIQTYGCLPAVGGDLGTLNTFSPAEMGAKLEQVINQAKEYGFPKITLHFDLPDAAKLAAFLRNPNGNSVSG